MFRFTIRDVLWLMVVVSLIAGWWVDRSAAIKARIDCESRLRRIADYLHEVRGESLVWNEWETYVVPLDGSEPIRLSKSPEPRRIQPRAAQYNSDNRPLL